MAFNYTPLATTATNLITNFGQSVTFTRRATSAYNPLSGATLGNTTYTAQIVLLNESKNEYGSNSVVVKPANGLQEQEHNALCSSTTAPKIGDTATINSEHYRITGVKPTQPSTTVVMYELRLAV